MTREEREKAIDALKISAPVTAVTQEEFNDYIQTLNKIMDWLEQEPCDDATKHFKNVYELSQTLGVSYDFIDEKIKEIIPALKKPSISEDGTLTVNVEDGNKVSRVLVCGDNHFGGLYYPEPFMNKPCVAHQICHEDKVKVLDKIRSEIEHLHDWAFDREEILRIIDKYRSESEGEDE